jgi:hypothetical protein
MKKEELVTIIKAIVKEEVEKCFASVLTEILKPPATNNDIITEKANPVSPLIRRKSMVSFEGGVPTAVAKPVRKFSNNPVLNKILNETEGGVPPEGALADSPSVLDVIQSVPKEQLNENSAMAAVAGALTKDYRSLLRAADAKAKNVPRPL